MEVPSVAVGDAQIECFSHGEGPAILLLAGGSLSVGYLTPLAEALSDNEFRAVRVPSRGAGGSTGPVQGLTLHDDAAEELTGRPLMPPTVKARSRR